MEIQGKLLRVLETKRVRMVGDTAERDIDIRLIAASNRDPFDMVKEGTFREDLYYRLNVLPIHLPPLRSEKAISPCWPWLSWNGLPARWTRACRLYAGSHGPDGKLSLAGKRPGAAEHRGAHGHPVRLGPH